MWGLEKSVVQCNSWHTGAGMEGTGEESDWCRREQRWEIVELGGHQRQEMGVSCSFTQPDPGGTGSGPVLEPAAPSHV